MAALSQSCHHKVEVEWLITAYLQIFHYLNESPDEWKYRFRWLTIVIKTGMSARVDTCRPLAPPGDEWWRSAIFRGAAECDLWCEVLHTVIAVHLCFSVHTWSSGGHPAEWHSPCFSHPWADEDPGRRGEAHLGEGMIQILLFLKQRACEKRTIYTLLWLSKSHSVTIMPAVHRYWWR